MTKENKQSIKILKSIKYIISTLILIITMFSTFAFATSQETISPTNDVIPPRGKLEIVGSTNTDGINYVESNEIEVKIIAQDNKTDGIKYYISQTAISNANEIAEGDWNTYQDGVIEYITLEEDLEIHALYLALKDAAGNTSIVYSGSNVEYTIEYNKNAEDATLFDVIVNTKSYYGMPFMVTTQIPIRNNYDFTGWSTNPNANTPSFKKGEIIPADVFVGGSKTITLYAVWGGSIVNVDGLGDIKVNNPDMDLTYNPDTGELGGVVPPTSDEPETPPEIPKEKLPEMIEFGYGNFELKTNYTPGTYETVEYETTYTRTKYPVSYRNIVWSEWNITKDGDGNIINTEPGDMELEDIDEQYSTYIVYDFETEEALESNGVKGDSVELWTIYNTADDTLENAVYIAAYLNKSDGKTTRHIAKWDGSKYVEYDADAQIDAVDTFVETYTVTNRRQVQITATTSSTEYVYVPAGKLKAEKGMTWAEWLVSEYNTTGETSPTIKTANYEDVLIDEVIEEGKEYGFILESIRNANAPILGRDENGELLMEAVYWSDENATTEYTADEFTTDMYSYVKGDNKTDTKQSRWANAKTKDDGSYWVWIPRYAYKITYYTDENKTTVSTEKSKYISIDVLFMNGISYTEYFDVDGNIVTTGLPEGYKVHPAFQAMTQAEINEGMNSLGKWDNELEGIWVAKYEASQGSNGKPESKPSVKSWSDIGQDDIYIACENLNSILGSHEMKNSEWGAVAYLAYSAYGRNGNGVGVNECGDIYHYTGAGPNIGVSNIQNGNYSYDISNFANTYAWNTERGKLASTTGNIYGIYDMVGGCSEYIAAYINNMFVSFNAPNMAGSSNLRNKQIYAVGNSDNPENNYNANIGVYGDTINETVASYIYPNMMQSFFLRGRKNSLFDFIGTEGISAATYGFRPVLCFGSGT